MTSDREAFYNWLDVIRFLAATTVVINHVRDLLIDEYDGNKLSLPFYAYTAMGHTSVIVFFVLSGFWISHTVVRRIDQADFWRHYLVDRLVRLLLVLVPVLLLGALLDWVGFAVLHSPAYESNFGRQSLVTPVRDRLSWSIFLGNLSFLQDIFVPAQGSNVPLWSLACEFWYYLWFPALLLAVRCKRPNFALLTLGIALFSRTVAFGFLSWLCGFTLMLVLSRRKSVQVPFPLRLVCYGIAGAAIIVSAGLPVWWFDPILAFSVTLGLYALAGSPRCFPPLLRGAAHFGAKSSYSLYALHFPVVLLIVSLISPSSRYPVNVQSVAILAVIVAGTLVFAHVFSELTEKNTAKVRQALRRALFQRNPSPPSAGVR